MTEPRYVKAARAYARWVLLTMAAENRGIEWRDIQPEHGRTARHVDARIKRLQERIDREVRNQGNI